MTDPERKQISENPELVAAYKASMWGTLAYIPDWTEPATEEAILAAESRLGVTLPESLRNQLRVQDGGDLDFDNLPFEGNCELWGNAVADGIAPVKEWILARDDGWFEELEDVPGLDLLVIIAAHSESHVCLDYRSKGPGSLPSVTYIDVSIDPTEVTMVAESIDAFIREVAKAKQR